jgi:hypothetical protein
MFLFTAHVTTWYSVCGLFVYGLIGHMHDRLRVP